jgi:2-desacetyl-2-hydroxyethyl bacteriochlorophyllide A dehydrogenase
MRAVRNTDEGVTVVDLPEPDLDAVDLTDPVLVEVRGAGICGTDLHLVAAGPMPQTLGHEIAGVDADGRAVAIEPIDPCWACERCLEGRYHLCRSAKGLGTYVDGGMADYVAAPSRSLVPLAEGVRPEDASLVEPLAVSLHGLQLADVQPGMQVSVVGGGTIGLTAAAIAIDLGAEVSLVARHPHQQAAAEAIGARIIDPDGKGVRNKADVAVEAAGSETSIGTAMALAKPGATVSMLGAYWGLIPVPGTAMMLKELRLQASYVYDAHAGPREVEQAADLMARRPELATTLITHRFGLDDAVEAFRVAGDRKAGAIKVVLQP